MILSYNGISPQLGQNNLVAPGAVISGDVQAGDDCSFWFNAVVRGDVHYVRIGHRTNIQDNCVLHETYRRYPLIIGNDVTVGHGAILHACTIHDLCLIGMNATVLDDAEVGEGSLIAAGALVRAHMKIPPRKLVAGVPAKIIRDVTDDEFAYQQTSARRYLIYKDEYLNGPNGDLFRP